MTVTTRSELQSALRSGHPVELVSRVENAIATRLSEVIVTGISERDVTVQTSDGVQHIVLLESLVNTDGERRRRNRWRRAGLLLDALGLAR